MLAVSWGLEIEPELVSAISADGRLVDGVFQVLRSHGHIGLFSNDDAIASSQSGKPEDVDTFDLKTSTSEGTRYPVRIEMSVDQIILRNWHHTPSAPLKFLVLIRSIGPLMLSYLTKNVIALPVRRCSVFYTAKRFRRSFNP